jgi:hypothetical protein
MPRMIDLIRASAVPATLMHAAARGALSVPPEEMIEILVCLTANRIFGQQARMTLAGWEESSSRSVASNPKAPLEVLQYLISPENLRPRLLPALLENPSVPEEKLEELASSASREVVEAMTLSERVNQLPRVLSALRSNPQFGRGGTADAWDAPPSGGIPGSDSEPDLLQAIPAEEKPEIPRDVLEPVSLEHEPGAAAEPAPQPGENLDVLDEAWLAFEREHAAEIAAEEGKAFKPIGGILGFDDVLAAEPTRPEPAAKPATPETGAAAPKHPAHHHEAEIRRGGALQKIARLDVRGRIQLAMKGDKEERSILIRDGTKIVALAVLDSPKITDGEVENIASQKNVLEAVLRGIPLKRRFAKNYAVIRNLVSNPRTPLDLSLGLMKNMLVHDLKNLSGNKEISETLRKLALRMFKQKADAGKKKE